MARDVSSVENVEVGLDLQFEKRWRVTQWCMWILLTLFVIAGAAGLFGRGALSKAEVLSGNGSLLVEYQRFARYQTPAVLKVTIRQSADVGRHIVLTLPMELLETLRLDQTSPLPETVTTTDGSAVLRFSAAAQGAQMQIKLAQQPDKPGRLAGSIAVQGAGAVFIKQLIYP